MRSLKFPNWLKKIETKDKYYQCPYCNKLMEK